MELEKDYCCLEQNASTFTKSIEVENDFQEALPAYCEDIYRVVKCTARSCIVSADISYNEVNIRGKIAVCLTYFNENSNLCYADFEEEFTKSVSVDNISENAFVCPFIHDKYVSYRVINQRRIDVHISSVIKLTVYDKIKCPELLKCDTSRLRRENVNCADIVNSHIAKLEFDEEFTIPADSQPIKRIVSYHTDACLNEIKIIKDKALIKAVVSLHILYTTDEAEEQLNRCEYSFNVSKIIDVPNIEEEVFAVSDIRVGNVYVKAKTSSGDKMNVISAFGEIAVTTVFIKEKQQEMITDGYLLRQTYRNSYADYACMTNGQMIQENKMLNLSVDFSADITEMKELSVTLSHPQYRNGKLLAQANIIGICLSDRGDINSVSASKELEIPIGSFDDAIASLSVSSVDYTLQQNGRVDIRLGVAVEAFAFLNQSFKVLSDMVPLEELTDTPSLTVYYAKEKESVWNIAKNTSADTEVIMRENGLSEEFLDNDTVLIIPRA